jgi:hypothetical protein
VHLDSSTPCVAFTMGRRAAEHRHAAEGERTKWMAPQAGLACGALLAQHSSSPPSAACRRAAASCARREPHAMTPLALHAGARAAAPAPASAPAPRLRRASVPPPPPRRAAPPPARRAPRAAAAAGGSAGESLEAFARQLSSVKPLNLDTTVRQRAFRQPLFPRRIDFCVRFMRRAPLPPSPDAAHTRSARQVSLGAASAAVGGCCGGSSAAAAPGAAAASSSCCGGSGGGAAAAPPRDAASAAMAGLEERYLSGTVSVSRADIAAAWRSGPAAAATARLAPAAAPQAEAFVDLEALLREARAAGGNALVFSQEDDDAEDGGVML